MHQPTLIVTLLIGLLGVGRLGLAQAQPARPAAPARLDPDRAARAKPDAATRAARRAKVLERVRAIRAARLTAELGLDEASAIRLTAAIAAFDDPLNQALGEAGVARAALEQAVASHAAAAELTTRTDALLAAYRKREEVLRDRVAAMRKVLDAAQAARAVLSLPRIEARLRHRVERASHRRRSDGALDPFAGPRPGDTGEGRRRRDHRRPGPAQTGNGPPVDPYAD